MTFRFGAALGELNDITPDDILSFLDAPPMKTGGSGRGDRATHLRSLLRFLLATRRIRQNLFPLGVPRISYKIPTRVYRRRSLPGSDESEAMKVRTIGTTSAHLSRLPSMTVDHHRQGAEPSSPPRNPPCRTRSARRPQLLPCTCSLWVCKVAPCSLVAFSAGVESAPARCLPSYRLFDPASRV